MVAFPLRVLASILSRAGIEAAIGRTFGGLRDVWEACGYKKTLTIDDYRLRYERGDIAARIVEALPWATWRAGGEVVEDEDPKVLTEFEKQWWEFAERLQLWPTFLRADILAGLGRYAVVVIGAPGQLNTPLPPKMTSDQILYLQAYPEDDAKILRFSTNTEDPRFGQPEEYEIRFDRRHTRGGVDSTTSGVVGRKPVHWSRIIHIAEGVDDQIYAAPRLERVWNRLDDIEKTAGGGSEAFWRRIHQGMQLNVDKDVQVTAEERAELQKQAEEYEHGLRRMFRTRGVNVEMFGSDVAEIHNHLDALLTLIAGAVGIPKRILLGSEQGQLASTQDKDTWDERVKDRRNNYAGPYVVRPFVLRMIQHGVLPTPVKFWTVWPEIHQIPLTDRSDIAVKWANVNYRERRRIIGPNEIRTVALGLHADPALDRLMPLGEAIEAAPGGEGDPDDRPSRSEREARGDVSVPTT